MSRSQARELARNTDPETSHQAARRMVDSDQLGEAQLRALKVVYRNANATASELSKAAGDGDPRKINRRLNELEKAGWISRHAPRRCKVTGRNAHTWSYNDT
jgi:DNA-binding MarR family transcriptional regulator